MSEEGSVRASKVLYACFAVATIVAMATSLAYSLMLHPVLTASPYTAVSGSNPALGIRLDLSVSSTSLKQGDKIAITMSGHNLRLLPNEVKAASNWKLRDLSLGPCGTVNFPIGFAIFQGGYTRDTIYAGKSLQLYKPGVYHCPMILSRIDSYAFDPSSSHANVIGSCSRNPCLELRVEDQTQVAGSWGDTPFFLGESAFHQFSPGVYTLAGGDEWGDLLVLNFVVV